MNYDKITYCIDANVLIVFHRYYPIELFPDLWERLGIMFEEKRIISHEIVFNEICHDKKRPDVLAKWILSKKSNFIDTTEHQINLLPGILKNFPKLIDPNLEREQADPWLIAMLIEFVENSEMFSSDMKYILVSNENKNSTVKLPAACKFYKLECINMFEFFQQNDWKFTIR